MIVEGRVEGDAAAVGGSVIQLDGSYVGGDVMVFGGEYRHGRAAPGRNPASKTIMFAGYEQELRGLARNPASTADARVLARLPRLRLLAVLFWFVVSLALTAVTPGAVGARGGASATDARCACALIGLVGALVLGPGVTSALHFLPPALGALVGVTALLLLLLSYLFGRVVIHAATGRWLQRVLLPEEPALRVGRAPARRGLLGGRARAPLRLALRRRRPRRPQPRPLAHRALPLRLGEASQKAKQ